MIFPRLFDFAPEPRPKVGDYAYLYRTDGMLSVVPPARGILRRVAEIVGVKSPKLYVRVGTVVDTSMFDQTGRCLVLEV
jgi:hypothetical protein